jgi:restriction-modification enzyme MmeI-like protein
MKAPSRTTTLEEAQPQAERYWRASGSPEGSYAAVRYVVLCSFHRILVWDMHQDPSRPAANLTLDELPDHYEALGFLVGEGQDASFVEHHRALTVDAAKLMSMLFHDLADRSAAPPDGRPSVRPVLMPILTAPWLTDFPGQMLLGGP